jgi:ferrous iron transport protein B
VKACCEGEGAAPNLSFQASLALVGNPNSGKTTLFNALTGARQRTGNWPGVTVERKSGVLSIGGRKLPVVDLPGTYSLASPEPSADERVARQFVLSSGDTLLLDVVDATTLEKGLFLTLQLRELGLPVVVVLNMMDLAVRHGLHVDVGRLADELGVPVVPVSLRKQQGMDVLRQTVLDALGHAPAPMDVAYPDEVEQVIRHLEEQHGWSRKEAVRHLYTLDDEQARLWREQMDEARFHHAQALARRVCRDETSGSLTWSDRIDRWVLGRHTAIPVFLLAMYLLFLFSINFGGALIDVFDQGAQAILVDGARVWYQDIGLPEWLVTFLADGLGGGLQVVASFIPVIGALYIFLTLLEESGYMARAAFIMDRLMRNVGVSGKAFVPLIIGFGCNVPAVMATRTLDSERERLATLMMAPFMTCGARLTVFALFSVTFFPRQGTYIVFLLYLTGIVVAAFTAWLLHRTILKGGVDDLLLELPEYRVPLLRNVLLNTWMKLKGFAMGAGRLIVVVVMFINILNSLGTDGTFGHQNTRHSVLSTAAQAVTPVLSPMGIQDDNWPATVGILTGILAKEVVVGTLDALYTQLEADGEQEQETPFDLRKALAAAWATVPQNLAEAWDNLADPLGLRALDEGENVVAAAESQSVHVTTINRMQTYFDGRVGAFAYMLFILLYFPCASTVGAMVRESSGRWTALSVMWSTTMAYAISVSFYQLARLPAHPWQSLAWLAAMLALLGLAIGVLLKFGRNPSRIPVNIQFS